MQTDIQKSNENVTSTTESKIIPLKKEYLAKIDVIPTVSFNKEQKAIAKKIIENTDEKDLNAVFSLITQRVKTGFVFDEAPEVNHDCVALVKENENLNINIGVLSEMEGKIEHKLIIGENYDALKNLCATYIDKSGKGLIDVIYIDPPYNTEATQKDGNDYKEEVTATKFIYRDKFTRDGWLNMMNERLKLAKRLLSEKGVIFISIDDSEQAYLKILCDEVFGEENFVGNIVWNKKAGGGQTDEYFVKEHEYISVFRKTDKFVWVDETIEKDVTGIAGEDENGKFITVKLEKWGSASHKYDRPTMYFPIKNPDGKNFYPIAPDGDAGRWRLGKKRMTILVDKGLVLWGKKINRWIPYEKVYCGDSITKVIKSRSLFLDSGETGDGTKELTDIFGKKDIFHNPKPVTLIKDLLSHCNFTLILDFFAGSGTTGQAVMELNEEDGGNRKFILVTNNENSIGEKITRERLYRVINGKCSNGESVTWTYSKEKPYLQNNAVRVFNIEHTLLTLNDLDKAEQLKETAQKEFVKLNPLYTTTNEFDIYNELAALNPQKEILPQNKANAEAKK